MRPARREFIAGAVAFSATLLGSARRIAALPLPSEGPSRTFGLNISELRVQVDDAWVAPGTARAHVLISLNEPAQQTVSLKFATGDDTATGDHHYVRKSGYLVFQPRDQFKIVTVDMTAALGPDEHFRLTVGWPQNTPSVIVENGEAVIAAGQVDPAWKHADAHPLPAKPASARVIFETDMRDFHATSTGFSKTGTPVWMSQLAHGREQPDNRELGYYVDPALHMATSPWGWDNSGRFFLQAERHAGGLLDLAGRAVTSATGMPFRYSSSIVTTKRVCNRFSVGCYAEAKLQMDPVFGSWPAFWLLPDDERSETLEIDVLEGFFREDSGAMPNLDLMATTVHWSGGEGSGGEAEHQMYSQSASIIRTLIPEFDPFASHVWGVHWGATALTFYVDDVPYFQLPSILPHKNCYLLLNLAVGGQAGMPRPDLDFHPRLYIDWVRVSCVDGTEGAGR